MPSPQVGSHQLFAGFEEVKRQPEALPRVGILGCGRDHGSNLAPRSVVTAPPPATAGPCVTSANRPWGSTSSRARCSASRFAPPSPGVGIGEAFALGLLDRVALDEDALALVAPACAAEADHDGAEAARPPGTAGQRGVATGQEHELVKVDAREAQRSGVVHDQKVAAAAALSARPILQRGDDEDVGRRHARNSHGARCRHAPAAQRDPAAESTRPVVPRETGGLIRHNSSRTSTTAAWSCSWASRR